LLLIIKERIELTAYNPAEDDLLADIGGVSGTGNNCTLQKGQLKIKIKGEIYVKGTSYWVHAA
jgi:hypothetical protein